MYICTMNQYIWNTAPWTLNNNQSVNPILDVTDFQSCYPAPQHNNIDAFNYIDKIII